MLSKKYLVAGLMWCCLSQIASAEDAGLSQQFSLCMGESGGVTVDMLGCIGKETAYQDVRLNKVYKEVMSQLTEERKKQLKKAQRAWIQFRDANCDFYADPDGGTMARVNSNDCVMSATASRAKELEGFKE
jgi:uncharacterized protein YecT (DUF1311 family)